MTDFDSLRGTWLQAGGGPSAHGPDAQDAHDAHDAHDAQDARSARDAAAQLQQVRARAERLERDVRRRDWRESIVALVLLPLFAFLAVTAASPLSALGAAIVAAACVVIPLRLRRGRRARGTAVDPARPVADALRLRLEQVRAQERLLGTVAWWYFAPIGIGVVLYVLGGDVPAPFKLAYVAGVALLCGWLLRLNRRVLERDVRPLAMQLQRWIEDLETTDTDEGDRDEA